MNKMGTIDHYLHLRVIVRAEWANEFKGLEEHLAHGKLAVMLTRTVIIPDHFFQSILVLFPPQTLSTADLKNLIHKGEVFPQRVIGEG
jgi:hypothetical protein